MKLTVLVALALLIGAPVGAHEDGPVTAPGTPAVAVPPPLAGTSAEARYNEGRAHAGKKDWAGAERAYRAATLLRPAFPEAWNGLGYALRQQGKYEDSVRAYQEALRLRPNYPNALEYLGEAYVKMGRLADARAVLERLRPLDPKEADELARAIAAASRR